MMGYGDDHGKIKLAVRSLQGIEDECDGRQDAQLLPRVSLEKLYGILSNSWQRRVEGPLLEALLPGWIAWTLTVLYALLLIIIIFIT